MDKKNMKKYAVIEIQDPPYQGIHKYQCIPCSWIRIQEIATDDAAVIKYPLDDDKSITKSRVKRNEPFSDSWPIFVVNIKYSTDSYKDAKLFIKKNFKSIDDSDKCEGECSHTNNEDRDAADASNKTTSGSKSNEENDNRNKNVTCDKYKEQEVLSKDESIPRQRLMEDDSANVCQKRVVLEADNIVNSVKYLTTQLQKALSKSFETLESSKLKDIAQDMPTQQCNNCNCKNNEKNKQSSDFTHNPTNPGLNRRTLFQTSFIDSLKSSHSNLKESYEFIDKLHTDFKKNLILMEKMIEIVEKFNNLRISDYETVIKKPDSNNITKKNENIRESQATKKLSSNKNMQNGDKEKLHERIDQTCNNSNNNVERMNIDEDNQKNADVIDSPVRITGFQPRSFTLPDEYDANDSRWTLKHHRKRKDLEELIPFSNIFVDAIGLKKCEMESNNCKTFARKLLSLIFTESALNTCSWSGKKAYAYGNLDLEVRPALDKHAKQVMFLAIDKYATKYNWDKYDDQTIIMSLRSKMQSERDKIYKKMT